jgi:cell division protease FtsH
MSFVDGDDETPSSDEPDDQEHMTRLVTEVYERQLVVFMEDIGLVVADGDSPGRGSTVALADFLNTLDGAMSRHSGVVTVATTNDPSAIDPAARRAARFDRIVHVPMPDLSGRAKIIGRCLRHLDALVDTAAIAGLTEGATGADLRELVRLGVLSTTGPISTEDLGGLARTGRWRPAEQGGYL